MTDAPHTRSPALTAMLARAGDDARFLSPVLRRFGLETQPEALAARLGCDSAGLDRLALCETPRDDRFAADVRQIAEYAGCDPVKLRDLLREATTVERLRGPAGNADVGRGLLLAARDRESKTSNDTNE